VLKKAIAFLFTNLLFFVVFSQELPLNYSNSLEDRVEMYTNDSIVNYSIKPIVPQFHNHLEPRIEKRIYRSLVARKLFFEHLLIIDTSDFYVTVDPLFMVEGGIDQEGISSDLLLQNTRGFQVNGSWKNKLTFSTSFYENQAKYPFYLDEYVKTYDVAPGQGRVKAFKTGAYDFAMASGRINYIPNKHLMLSLGQDKNFIGEGYRSFLLSDNAFNYPFVSAQTNFFNRKLNYLFMIAGLQDLVRVQGFALTENIFQRKTASIKYLEYSPHPKIKVGFYESTISVDALAKQRGGIRGEADYRFLNPVIGVNSALNGTSDSLYFSNQGFNISIRPLKNWLVYGQLALKDYNFSALAGQVGIGYYGIKGLFLRGEWNESSNGVFGNLNNSASQTHYNQYLAHPYGDHFQELLFMANYQFKRFNAEAAASQTNFYTLINKEYLINGAVVDNYKLLSLRGQLGFTVNHATNMQFNIGWMQRFYDIRETPDVFLRNTSYIYISFQTALTNRYRDF
jgi:hypothetical protein